MDVFSALIECEPLVDAFAYRGFIYGWNYDNELLVFGVEALSSQLADLYGTDGLTTAYALFCSRGIGATDDMKCAFEQRSPRSREQLHVNAEPLVRVRDVGPFRHVLDMQITYDRIYLATETGLIVAPLNPMSLQQGDGLPAAVQVEGECLAVSSGLRAVGASFGTDGLSVITNEPDESFGPRRTFNLPLQSVRSSISGSILANFPSHEQVQRIPVSVSRKSPRSAGSLTGIQIPTSAERALAETSSGYVIWDGPHRRTMDIPAELRDAESRWYSEQALGATDDAAEVLSATFTGNRYLVLETPSSVSVLRDGRERLIQRGASLSVRTYKNSWRYRRLITATHETSLGLYAVLNGRYVDE